MFLGVWTGVFNGVVIINYADKTGTTLTLSTNVGLFVRKRSRILLPFVCSVAIYCRNKILVHVWTWTVLFANSLVVSPCKFGAVEVSKDPFVHVTD